MKNIDDNNEESTAPSGAAANSASGDRSPAANGRRLTVDADSPFGDLLDAYTARDRTQLAAMAMTGKLFTREISHYMGHAGPDLDVPYDFISLAETTARHLAGNPPRRGPSASSDKLRRETSADDTRILPSTERTLHCGKKSRNGKKKDRGAGRRLRRLQRTQQAEQAQKEQQEASQAPEPLPGFPGFALNSTFNGWAHQFAWPDDIAEYSTLLGTSTSGTYRYLTFAVTLIHGLPQFHQRCLAGDFTNEHIEYVARRCRDVAFRYLPSVDNYLAARRADITIETFKHSLSHKISTLQPAKETLKNATKRRRVDISTGDDGTSYLTLTGPAPELHALYRRIEAFARAVSKGDTGIFGDQLKPGEAIDDDRSIDNLMFDILTRTRPQLKLRVTSNDSTSGTTTITDFPLAELFAGSDGVPHSPEESMLDFIERTFGQLEVADSADADKAITDADADGSAQSDAPDSLDNDHSPDASVPATHTFAPWVLDALMNSRTTTCEFDGDAFGIADDGTTLVGFDFLLDLPTQEYWLSQQARTVFTVPFLTLLSQYLKDSGKSLADAESPEGCGEGRGSPPRTSPSPPTSHSTSHSQDPLTWGNPPDRDGLTADTMSVPLTDVCDLAGMLPDGSPLPPDMARRMAGFASTWTRILTDPATGTPLDAKATSYRIPNDVRQTLKAQWINCTMPGCSRRAETSEIDHIVPFDHDSPENGGLTRFGNLHPLCGLHHQAKTDKKFSVEMTEPGRLDYRFKHGVSAEVFTPDNPANVEHARLFLSYFAGRPPPRTPVPENHSDGPPTGDGPPPNQCESETQADGHYIGQRTRAKESPGPAAGDGQPGWIEYSDLSSPTIADGEFREWFWDSGEKPPF